MLKLGRFLFGNWLKIDSPIEFKKGSKYLKISGSYSLINISIKEQFYFLKTVKNGILLMRFQDLKKMLF